MIIYSLLYLFSIGLMLSFFTFQYKLNKSASLVFELLFIIIFSIILSQRNILDSPDTNDYFQFFNSINFTNFNIYRFEIGFKVYTLIFKILINDFRIYLFSFPFLFSLLFLVIIRKSIKLNPGLIYLIVLLAYFGIYYSGIVIRQSIALALVSLVIVNYFNNGKLKINDLFIIFISIIFHNSALIIIPIFLISMIKIKEKFIFTILVVLVYFIDLGRSVMPPLLSYLESIFQNSYYINYFSRFEWNGSISLWSILIMLLLLYVSLSFKKGKFNEKLFSVVFFGGFLYSLFRSIPIVERIAEYFIVFLLLLIFKIIESKSIIYKVVVTYSLTFIFMYISIRILIPSLR